MFCTASVVPCDACWLLCVILIGLCLQTIAVIGSLLLVDRVGRKKLLISGCLIMAISLFIMAHINKDVYFNKRLIFLQYILTRIIKYANKNVCT